MDAAGTDEWLGELGRDLHGPMESCCFFLMATTFWATGEHGGRNRLFVNALHINNKNTSGSMSCGRGFIYLQRAAPDTCFGRFCLHGKCLWDQL